jgi:hypothetical protein
MSFFFYAAAIALSGAEVLDGQSQTLAQEVGAGAIAFT